MGKIVSICNEMYSQQRHPHVGAVSAPLDWLYFEACWVYEKVSRAIWRFAWQMMDVGRYEFVEPRRRNRRWPDDVNLQRRARSMGYELAPLTAGVCGSSATITLLTFFGTRNVAVRRQPDSFLKMQRSLGKEHSE